MISDVLQLLLRANLAASLAIAVVMLLRWPMRATFGAPAAYRLWTIPPVMALASLVPTPVSGPLAPIVLPVLSGLASAAPLTGGSQWIPAIAMGWGLGALLLAGVLAAQQLRFASALRLGSRSSVAGRPVVRAASPEVGPAVVGGAIVLPSDFEARFTPAEQAAVIAHEAQHLARGDAAANAVLALVQCLCWFNPLVHLAAHCARFDQELACDAAVLAARPDLRRSYAEALLKTQVVVAIPPVGCAWRGRGFPELRSRIRLLKRRGPSRPRRICGLLVLAALALGGGYAAWAAQPARGPILAHPDWSSLPGASDLARFYPRKASDRGIDGLAIIRCRVERTGALSACTVVREAPQGFGFGRATLRLAPLFRMKPMSVDRRPVAGGIVMVPVKFRLHP